MLHTQLLTPIILIAVDLALICQVNGYYKLTEKGPEEPVNFGEKQQKWAKSLNKPKMGPVIPDNGRTGQ